MILTLKYIHINIKKMLNQNENTATHTEEATECSMGDIDDMCEWDKYVKILNIFQSYYKNLYKTSSSESLFNGIDYDSMSSTNRALELLYQYTLEFKQNKCKGDMYVDIYQTIDMNMYEEIYMMIINGNSKLYSSSLLSLISHLANGDEWQTNAWTITKIKGDM